MTHDDKDEFEAGFTDAEREAGVPDLFRTRRSETRPAMPEVEVVSTLSQKELTELLLAGVCFSVKQQVQGSHQWSTSDVAYAYDQQDVNVYVAIDEDTKIPVSLLARVLRENEMPAAGQDGDWLVWDKANEAFKTVTFQRHDRVLPRYSGFPIPARFLPIDFTPKFPAKKFDQNLFGPLISAAASTDHGMRPLLIRKDRLDSALQRNKFVFEVPQRVVHDIDSYVLGFFDHAGEIVTIPLDTLHQQELPIFTRHGSYRWRGSSLHPHLSYEKMFIAAFQIAKQHKSAEFEWYCARQKGTVFQAAFERVEALEDRFNTKETAWDELGRICRYYSEYSRSNDYKGEGHERGPLGVATKICELSSTFGSVYIAIGGHPLDVDLVTTPDLYLHAMRILTKHGYIASKPEGYIGRKAPSMVKR